MSPQARSALARAEHSTTVRRRPTGRAHTHAGRPAARRVSGPVPRAHTRVSEGTLVGDVLRTGVLRVLPGRPAPAPALPGRAAPRALPRRTGRAVVRLPNAGLLDTLLRSRAWIWLIGVLLGGIVAMQVSLLKLNTGIGRAVTTMSTLERHNAELEAQIARLSSGERIQGAAVEAGLVMPDAGAIGYLTVRPDDARRAAARMQPPSTQAQAVMAAGGAAIAPVTTEAPATIDPVTPAPAATTTAPEPTTAPAADHVHTTPAPAEPTVAPASAPAGEG